MKIFFNKADFPNVFSECDVNYLYYSGPLLERDIEYIESDTNKILLEDDIDRDDFQSVLDNWDVLIRYIMESIEKELVYSENGAFISDRLEVLEYKFLIEGLK